jgi:YfiH family protein
MLTADSIETLPGIRHGFFSRQGGVSDGAYTSLNCGFGSGDEPGRVAANRACAMQRLDAPADRLATAYQVHSDRAAVVEAPWPLDQRPQVDALVTRTPGLALGVLTADCVPLLLADQDARVVAAVHAGWRGALAGVAERAIDAMTALGARADGIAAAIGPAIEQPSYEVGSDFPAPFVDQDPANESYFEPAPRNGHYLFDLKGYLARRLTLTGIGRIDCLAADTCAEPERFFSYRRTCLDGGREYGRLLSVIYLEP